MHSTRKGRCEYYNSAVMIQVLGGKTSTYVCLEADLDGRKGGGGRSRGRSTKVGQLIHWESKGRSTVIMVSR